MFAFPAIKQRLSRIIAHMEFRTPAIYSFGDVSWAESHYRFEETGGSTASDENSVNDMTYTAMTLGKMVPEIYTATGFNKKKAAECANGSTAKIEAASSSVFDYGLTSFGFRLTFRCPEASNGSLVYKRDTGSPQYGWSLLTQADGNIRVYLTDGSNVVDFDLVGNFYTGATHTIDFVVDRTLDECRIRADGGTSTVADISSLGDLSNVDPLSLGDGGSNPQQGLQFIEFAIGSGSAAESIDSEDYCTHAKDPNGILTEITRSSLISLMLSESEVGHFAPDQLPIGWAQILGGGSGGYGLRHNRALTNLLTYSEDHSSWGGLNVSNDGISADAPDNFFTARKITATNNNGYKWIALTSAAATTTYTFLVWVKRGAGTNVTGKIRLVDTTNGITQDQTFTATDTWQRIKVEITTGASAPTVRSFVYIDNNTDELLFWGAMAVEGSHDIDIPYIRTSGGTQTLDVPTYLTTAAQYLPKARRGEVEMLWSRSSDHTCNLWEARGSGNSDKRYTLATNGFVFRGYVYDSGGVLASFTSASLGPDPRVQTVVQILAWDEDSGLDGGYEGSMSAVGNNNVSSDSAGGFTSDETLTTFQLGTRNGSGPVGGWIEYCTIRGAQP